MSKDSNKTELYISLLFKLISSEQKSFSKEQITEFLNSPPKSTLNRHLNELKSHKGLYPAILLENSDNTYSLNINHWGGMIRDYKKGALYLECLKSLGMLVNTAFGEIDISDIQDFESEMHTRKDSNLNRKFIFLSKVQSRPFSDRDRKNLESISDALIRDEMINIDYYHDNEGELKSYKNVAPLSLCQHREDLYLIGQVGNDPNKQRTFKVVRIESVKKLGESFSYPLIKDYHPQELYRDRSGLIPGEVKEAEFRVYSHSRRLFKEKAFFNHKQNIQKSTDKYDTYTCKYTNPREFIGQLFIYAQDIQIVSPQDLREEFLEKARASLQLNS